MIPEEYTAERGGGFFYPSYLPPLKISNLQFQESLTLKREESDFLKTYRPKQATSPAHLLRQAVRGGLPKAYRPCVCHPLHKKSSSLFAYHAQRQAQVFGSSVLAVTVYGLNIFCPLLNPTALYFYLVIPHIAQ